MSIRPNKVYTRCIRFSLRHSGEWCSGLFEEPFERGLKSIAAVGTLIKASSLEALRENRSILTWSILNRSLSTLLRKPIRAAGSVNGRKRLGADPAKGTSSPSSRKTL
jgi:hypothetical protein